MTATLIDDRVRTIDAHIEGGRVLLDPQRLRGALGWELKPEGLCRDEICVPVRDRDALFVRDDLDLGAVAGALRLPVVVDVDAELIAVALPPEQRRQALTAQLAPHFTLDDLDGRPHSLGEWAGRKKLLIAFASW